MNEELANCSRGRVLWLLFWNFFKIALFVVGGGFAIILAAEESFVKRLRWLKEGELLDMLTVIQSVPGLTAGNAAIYVGYRAAGHAGALIALFGVALPSFTVITLLSMGLDFLPLDNLYLQSAFIGVRTAMAGLMIATVARLWRKIMSGFFPWFVMLACFLLMTFTKVNPGWLIAGSMAAGIASAFMPRAEESRGVATLLLLFVLFVYFGLLCFGGGAVLVNFYIHELVELRHWLTLDELADMVAISQVTPGPIGVNIATFIGYRQGGFRARPLPLSDCCFPPTG
ncbi:chromate transporter [Victivallis vadensis]|uniref:chromate transporter n=1 Tax=Victivallis vadensis TaxID=172901 RepID=UPI003AF50A27